MIDLTNITPVHERKNPRLETWDYTTSASYFVTVVAHDRITAFGTVAPDGSYVALSDIGRIIDNAIVGIEEVFPEWSVDSYVIMPNHIHVMFTRIGGKAGEHPLGSVVRRMKSQVTKDVRKVYPDFTVWQGRYHDHIVRDQADYNRIWAYIEDNPAKWAEDRYYEPEETVGPNS